MTELCFGAAIPGVGWLLTMALSLSGRTWFRPTSSGTRRYFFHREPRRSKGSNCITRRFVAHRSLFTTNDPCVGWHDASGRGDDAMLEPPRNESVDALPTARAFTDVAEICYTSGTTGTPKGVMLFPFLVGDECAGDGARSGKNIL